MELELKRVGSKNKFRYLDQNNKEIKNNDVLDRIDKLVIPPAYKNVKIAKNPYHYVQAIGEDDKGRRQYLYRQSFVKRQETNKYCQLQNLGSHLHKIRAKIRQNLKSTKSFDTKDRVISLVLYLLDNCYFRIGNINYYKLHNSHGVSTLQPKHITFLDNGEIEIKFIGKKGVLNQCNVKDKVVISLIKKHYQTSTRKKFEFLFNYKNGVGHYHIISPHDINTFLTKFHPDITLKMFRTWGANYIFLEEMLKRKKDFKEIDTKHKENDKRNKQREKIIREVVKVIADKLHNTPTISKKSYIDNNIVQIYFEDPKKFWKKVKSSRTKDLTNLLVEFLGHHCKKTLKKSKSNNNNSNTNKKTVSSYPKKQTLKNNNSSNNQKKTIKRKKSKSKQDGGLLSILGF